MTTDALRPRVSPSGPFEPPPAPPTPGGITLYGPFAARPAPGNRGNRYISSDGRIEFVDDGSAWRPLVAGVPGTEPPLVADFTTLGAVFTFVDATGTIVATAAAGAVNTLSALVVPKGATVTTASHTRWAADGTTALTAPPGVGLCVRDSVGGHLTTALYFVETGGGPATPFIEVDHWTDLATLSAAVIAQSSVCDYTSGGIWMRFRDDGVDHFFDYSTNGVDWVNFFSEARATFVPNGGDQVGLAALSGNPITNASANLVSFLSQ